MKARTATCRKCAKEFSYNHVRGSPRVNCDECKIVNPRPRMKFSPGVVLGGASGIGSPVSNAMAMLSDASSILSRYGWHVELALSFGTKKESDNEAL